MDTCPYGRYVWKQSRLERGWDDMQLIGRMKIHACREGIVLPRAWLLRKLVFSWEQHQSYLPEQYARLLEQIFSVRADQLYTDAEVRH